MERKRVSSSKIRGVGYDAEVADARGGVLRRQGDGLHGRLARGAPALHERAVAGVVLRGPHRRGLSRPARLGAIRQRRRAANVTTRITNQTSDHSGMDSPRKSHGASVHGPSYCSSGGAQLPDAGGVEDALDGRTDALRRARRVALQPDVITRGGGAGQRHGAAEHRIEDRAAAPGTLQRRRQRDQAGGQVRPGAARCTTGTDRGSSRAGGTARSRRVRSTSRKMSVKRRAARSVARRGSGMKRAAREAAVDD